MRLSHSDPKRSIFLLRIAFLLHILCWGTLYRAVSSEVWITHSVKQQLSMKYQRMIDIIAENIGEPPHVDTRQKRGGKKCKGHVHAHIWSAAHTLDRASAKGMIASATRPGEHYMHLQPNFA